MSRNYMIILLCCLTLFLSSCHMGEDVAEDIETVTETSVSVSTEETIETTWDELSSEEIVESVRTCQGYETYQWMIGLKAEDIAYIEFVNLADQVTPYRRYDGEEIQEVIDLFQSNECYKYKSSASWDGYFTTEFHIIMKDGTAHSVCSIQSVTTVIDGAAYETFSTWLNYRWPKTGVSPLPEDWEEQAATRTYHTVADEVSFLGTHFYDTEVDRLNREFDTRVTMGSASRNYPIGRSVVTLYVQNKASYGCTLGADWTGSFGGRKVFVKSDYWLEQWSEEEGTYLPLDSVQSLQRTEIELSSQEATRWYVSWEDIYGNLSAGHYRIGMTVYEDLNGIQQNETLCYAKFQIEG